MKLVAEETPEIERELRNRSEPYPRLVKLTETLLMKKPEARLGNSQDLISELEAAAKSVVGSSDEPLHGYIATALTGVEEDTREAIAFVSSTIANACKRFEIYVYQPRKVSDPLLNPDLKPETVYSTDRKRVLAADLLIVASNNPSFGVGQELEIAASFGVPTLLVRREGCKLSRMVIGSFLNLVDEISYTTPEDLEEKLKASVSRNVERIRSFKSSSTSGIVENLGAKLRAMRQGASLSIEEAANQIGCSPRLIHAVEEKPVRFHNIGLHVFGRIVRCYGKTVGELFDGAVPPPTARPAIDQNTRRLEQVARSQAWPFADYLELRTQYEQSLVASGDSESITLQMWEKRHAALLTRRLKEVQPNLL